MNFHILTALFIALTALIGCGADVASKQKSKPSGNSRNQTTLTGDGSLISSQIHRLRGFEIISYLSESEQLLKNSLPASYKLVPNILLDDEGTDTQNVYTTTSLGRPGVTCGVGSAFTGITARIADCKNKNGDKALWSGQLYGAAGESTWTLVAFTETSKEIWQDLRTGMVWSDVVSSVNWCKASGNKQEATGTAILDCSTLGEEDSICVGANIEGLGANVVWRLPTRSDYLQADIDGIRFVVKKYSSIGNWTATLQAASTGREHAWAYNLTDGTLSAQPINTDRHVRCIGAPAK